MNEDKKGMTIIVKTITKLVSCFIFIFGFYIILNGHLTPGGGFAGGSILAGALTLIMIAYGKEKVLERLSHASLNFYDCIGAIAFVLLGMSGLLFGKTFLLNFFCKGNNFDIYSSGNIFWYNLAIGLKVGASIFAMLLGISMFRINSEKKEENTK